MSINYADILDSNKATTRGPLPGREAEMVKNHDAHYVFEVSKMIRLRRFLIIGCQDNTFYQTKQELIKENVTDIIELIKADGLAVLNEVREVSLGGLAQKQDQGIFVLALIFGYGNLEVKRAAKEAFNSIVRTASTLFMFMRYAKVVAKSNKSSRSTVANWYNSLDDMSYAYQTTKYGSREGWCHRDLFRWAHVKPADRSRAELYARTMGKDNNYSGAALEYLNVVDEVKRCTNPKRVVELISKYNLPREVIPTEHLKSPLVWEALLPHMGATALIRNLGAMTSYGLITDLSEAAKLIRSKLGDQAFISKGRIHPLSVLIAILIYRNGRGERGSLIWTPNRMVLDALDDSFYMAFKNVQPTGKNILLALDVSGSMSNGMMAGISGLTPRIVSAAMAMVTARTEPNVLMKAFSTDFFDLDLSRHSRLPEVVNYLSSFPFAGTNCSLPMQWAQKNGVPVDAFMVYTDSETNHSGKHPSTCVKDYRQALNKPDACLGVVAMTATNFSIADPKDLRMMDFAGFDSSLPQIMKLFIEGAI